MNIINRLFPVEHRALDREIIGIEVPCLLENLLTYSATLITAAMIGRLTADEISAQSIGSKLCLLMISLFKGIGTGATIVVATQYGAKKFGACRRIIEQFLLSAVVISTAIVLLMLYFTDPLLRIFANDETIISIARPYVQIALWLCPFMAISRIVTSAFNAQGDTKTPMYIAFATNIINAFLCYIFVFGIGGFAGMGIMGAAWALVISYASGTVAGIWLLYWSKNALYRNVEKDAHILKIDRSYRDVYTFGIPVSFESMMYTFSGIIISRALLSYGSVEYAAFNLAGTAEEFFFAPAAGFQIAICTLAGRGIGAGDYSSVVTAYKRICTMAYLIILPLAGILLITPNIWMRLLTTDVEIRAVGVVYLILAAIEYPAQAFNTIDFGLIRSVGYKTVPLIGTVIGMWCVRVPVAVFAAWVLKADVLFVFMGLVFDQYIRLIISKAVIKRKKLLSDSPILKI